MRRNQISLKIERFGDDAPDGKHQVITIYTDSNNIWEALAAANNLAASEIMKTTNLPEFGASEIRVK